MQDTLHDHPKALRLVECLRRNGLLLNREPPFCGPYGFRLLKHGTGGTFVVKIRRVSLGLQGRFRVVQR